MMQDALRNLLIIIRDIIINERLKHLLIGITMDSFDVNVAVVHSVLVDIGWIDESEFHMSLP